ncbi:peptidyl-prolyl cis-trans isomerase [Sporosarcina sp. PTS2304]|uniref:peptidyl-prolyl cis-trans isomerase n=1 Tax=Sporosarcina sp. PTS2304 TaxID=2283194 RepID=UPI000E0CD117|nr:peptidyl-prolyl cis-trans isomerase [Sporosarcina sp. PTS2304]AXH98584.1 peptidyl-prolyl cis-trans isomerase [Sporosarcina sp. PTS2304]
MEFIIPITGNVKHSITLDPTVWIFDDRRIDLDVFFTEDFIEKDEMEEYKEKMGKHWSREIMEGATYPPTIKSEKRYEKDKMLTSSFGMVIEPFIRNAVPSANAKTFTLITKDDEKYTYPLAEAANILFKFSHKGKPLREDGPVHVLFKDGSNQDSPIRHVQAIQVD